MKNLLASSLLAIPLLFGGLAKPARAADYCSVNWSGQYVCILGVFGPRSNRTILGTVNGYFSKAHLNCYYQNYDPTSIVAIGCWDYYDTSY